MLKKQKQKTKTRKKLDENLSFCAEQLRVNYLDGLCGTLSINKFLQTYLKRKRFLKPHLQVIIILSDFTP